MSEIAKFTGYDPKIEPRELLTASCIQFDYGNITCSSDMPPRKIREKFAKQGWPLSQQMMSSCAGWATVHGGTVCNLLATGEFRAFFPTWTYKHARRRDGIRGDNGATIHNVVVSAKEDGLLPVDVDRNGKAEFIYNERDFEPNFPASAAEVAEKFQIKFSVELRSFEAIVNFIKSGSGAVIIGSGWGGVRPDAKGVVRSWSPGGGAHARSWCDVEEIDGEEVITECNSWSTEWAIKGFAFYTRKAVEQLLRDRWTVFIGISDLEVENNVPKPRKIREFVKF